MSEIRPLKPQLFHTQLACNHIFFVCFPHTVRPTFCAKVCREERGEAVRNPVQQLRQELQDHEPLHYQDVPQASRALVSHDFFSRDEDPVLTKKTGSGALYLKRREILKIYKMALGLTGDV